MEGPPLGPGGEDITWPDQVAPRGRKASSTRKIKPQTSNQHCNVLTHPHVCAKESNVFKQWILQKIMFERQIFGTAAVSDPLGRFRSSAVA